MLSAFLKRKFTTRIGPNQPRTMGFSANPILFNVRNERYVIQGKEKLVGAWLGLVSASIFAIVVIGGHTRLTKSGLSMVRWEPHRILPPTSQAAWEAEFEEYKKSPEYIQINKGKGMDVNGFKYIFFWEWFHRIVGRSIGFIFFGPMTYFFYKGYIQRRLKYTLMSMFALGGLQGFIGWWMVSSGLKDKHETTEVDKTPRVSPYRLTVHAGNAYLLYAVCLWQSLNCYRPPQESFITLKNIQAHNVLRRQLFKFTFGLVPLVLVTGFFVAGTNAGISCNTYPWVGENYFYSKKHFISGIPTWQNFTENKLVTQVNHRTIATLMTLYASHVVAKCLRNQTGLTKQAKFATSFLVFALWMQLGIGVTTIWESVPTHLASAHQIGAMTVLTAFVMCMHTCRRVDQRHLRNLMGKLRVENPQAFEQMTKSFNKQVLSRREYEQMRQHYVSK